MKTAYSFFPGLLRFRYGQLAGLLLLASVLLSSCTDRPADEPVPQAAGHVKDLTVGMGNGVNIQPSYYNNGYPDFDWSLMKQQGRIRTLRIEIEPDKVNQAKYWISQAKANGYSVIATYHKYTVLGSSNPADLQDAANWWRANYGTLGGGFVVNLMNEWGGHEITADAYARAYNSAIATVRQVYGGPIIIDCPGYGQETATTAAAVKGYNSTPIYDTSIVLAMHVYPNAYNQAKSHYLQNADLDDLASAGRQCIIGEFGYAPAGPVYWQGIVNYAKGKGWTVMGWSWNGDGNGMNMVAPAWSTNPTATSFTLDAYFDQAYALL